MDKCIIRVCLNLYYMCIYARLSVAVWGLQDGKTAGKSCDVRSEGGAVTSSLWCGETDGCRIATGQSAAWPHRSHNHRCVFVSVKSEDVKRGCALCLDPLCCCSASSHPRWHVWADVAVSATHHHPKTPPYSAGSGHAHLWWICIYLAILPGDMWWDHRPGINEHISKRY